MDRFENVETYKNSGDRTAASLSREGYMYMADMLNIPAGSTSSAALEDQGILPKAQDLLVRGVEVVPVLFPHEKALVNDISMNNGNLSPDAVDGLKDMFKAAKNKGDVYDVLWRMNYGLRGTGYSLDWHDAVLNRAMISINKNGAPVGLPIVYSKPEGSW